MKKKLLYITPLLLITSLIFIQCNSDKWPGCLKGKGSTVTEYRNFSGDVQGIDLNVPADLYVTQGDANEFKIVAQQNILDNMKTELRGDVVKVTFDKCVKKHAGITIYATIPYVKYLKIDGSGKIVGTDTVYTDEIQFAIEGSGNILFTIKPDTFYSTTKVYTSIDGSGDVELIGLADEHHISITGSGDIDAYRMDTEDTFIEIKGSGNCWVYATNYLYVDIDGSGDVYYGGNPDIEWHISGSGELHEYP